ncbi:unnamed protein product, partial [Symbiodinium pilosum]
MSTSEAGSTPSKNREGPPTWNGAAETFQSYEEAARLYEQTTPYQKRYLCGPKLQNALEGAALRLVVGKRPDWLSDAGGVNRLLAHLRQCLGKPQMPELTDLLSRYFRMTKRKAGETMNGYITRKCEVYVRWCRTGTKIGVRATRPGRATLAAQVERLVKDWERGQGWWSHQWYPNSWSRGYGSDWQWNSWNSSDWTSDSRPTTDLYAEVVPEFIQAWLLLSDANLETQERNLIVTALQGELNLQRVAQELRTHFPDSEVQRRDGQRRQHGYLGSIEEEESEDEPGTAESQFQAETELTEEGFAAWTEAEVERQQALAAVQHARRTLKGARERQKMVKLNRQYFRGFSSSRGSDTRPDEKLTCLRCGQTGHRAANCPAPQPKEGNRKAEMAPFVCYTSTPDAEQSQDQGLDDSPCVCFTCGPSLEQALQSGQMPETSMTTSEALNMGKAIIDCGATKSLGSVYALEKVMQLSANGVNHVDVNDKPVFGFGNSSEDRCVSTLHLNLQAGGRPGQLKIHALDKGSAPILFSVASLKALVQKCHLLQALVTSPVILIMSDLTRDQLRAALKAMGEEPPIAWTKMELRFRLQEITGEDLSLSYKKLSQGPPSEYQEWLRQLKQAKTKKATLQKFVSDKLKLTNVDNMTIAQLEIHALRKIYEIAKPHHSDPLGFGKHGSKSYLTVQEEERGYCSWISKTAREDPNGCDPRLLRFSQWLEMCNKEEMIPEDRSVTKIKVPAQAMKPPKREATAEDPASEVDKMKEEQKPRKKGTKPREPESDTSSYQMVMQTEEEVQELCGDASAASRCSWWNNCDLATDAGVRLVLNRLPIFQSLQTKYNMYQAVSKGCRVNLRDKAGVLMQKGPERLPEEFVVESATEDLEKAARLRAEAEKAHGQESTPWTYTRVAAEIGGNQFQDVSGDIPSSTEWSRAQDVLQELPPVRFRFRGKRAQPEPLEIPEEAESDGATSSRNRAMFSNDFLSNMSANVPGERWYDHVPESAWFTETSDYWQDRAAAIEVEIPLPESRQGLEQATRNLEAYFTGALKRRAVEVSEKRLSPEDRLRFQEAKSIEIKNYLAAQAFEVLPRHLQPSRERAIQMRWLLTWKVKDDGSTKPKARCVILGYQDEAYEHRATSAPVMTKQPDKNSKPRAMVVGHVDDFLFAGSDHDQGFKLSQEAYAITIPEIPINSSRR